MKIANLVTDEKFIDGMMYTQSMLPDACEHEYIMVTDDHPHTFRSVKNFRNIRQVQRVAILDYINHGDFDAVFLHGLFSMPLSLIPQIGQDIVVCWFAWGYDIYGEQNSDRAIRINLHHERTLPLIKTPIRTRLKNKMKHEVKLLINWKNYRKVNGGGINMQLIA